MIGDKKSIYHSTLFKFGDAYVTVKSDVLTSKYKREGESGHYYVILEHDGDEQNYLIENARCAKSFQGLKGQSVTIRATGSREDAEIEIIGSQGRPQKSPQGSPRAPQARPNDSGGSAQPTDPDEALQAFKKNVMKSANALYVGLKAAAIVAEQVKIEGLELDNDMIFRAAMNFVINADRANLTENLTHKPLWGAEEQLKPRPEPQPDIENQGGEQEW